MELAAIKARQVDEPLKGGRQPNERGQAKAARELGISEPDARRATKVASLSDEAKQVARDTGLDNVTHRTRVYNVMMMISPLYGIFICVP